ncbi:unnamed protein product [Lupinus luteus]|uniref:Uncharacterized protein n=1 Tax=Lupinus luteus TaxID=3873 RepID=A0AAV1YJC8_LUPLU
MAESDNTNIIFIDTSLHTHLALFLSHKDTIFDLKKRIVVEHQLCFPKIGQIEIHAVKVKRKECFYHLSDSMFVRSAFNGVRKNWFLSVDASALVENGQHRQLLLSSGSPNKVACLAVTDNVLLAPVDNAMDISPKRVSDLNYSLLPQLENKQDENEVVPLVSLGVSEHSGKEVITNLGTDVKSSGNNDTGNPLPRSVPETEDHRYVNNEHPSLQIAHEVDRTSKSTHKDDCNACEEGLSISAVSVKKQRKRKRKKEDTERDDISKENIASVDNPLSVSSKRVSRSNNFKVPQVENKLVEKEISHFGSPFVSDRTRKEVVQNLENGAKSSGNSGPGIPLLGSVPVAEDHVKNESEVYQSSKCNTKDDCHVREDDPSISMPSAKKKRKSKKKKEDTMQDDTSTENIASVDNALRVPSKSVSSFNSIQKPHWENKKDEKQESHFASSCVSKNTGEVVKKLGKGVESSTNNDTGIPLLGSTPETKNHHNVNKEIPSKLDGSSKGTIKNDCNVHEEDPSTPMPSVKEKRRSKRKKENIVQDDTSKENIDNPLSVPSKKVFSLNNFQASKLGSEQDEKDDIDIGDESVKEASTAGPTAIKKHKKRKRSSTHDSKEMLELETTSQKDEAQKPDEAYKQSKESKDQLEYNNDTSRGDSQSKHNKVTEDFSDTRTPAKKKQKGKDKSTPGVDLSMNKSTINNMEIGKDAHKESIGSKVHPSDVLSLIIDQVIERKELTEHNVNIVIDHCHKNDAGQSKGAEEVRELSPQNDPKPMLLEESPPSNQDNTGANVRESNGISKVVDEIGMTEPVKSEKKTRGTRKAKDSGREPSPGEGTDLVDASDNGNFFRQFFKAINCNPKSGNTEIEENPINQTEAGEKQEEEMNGTVLSATAKEDDLSADNAGSLDNAEDVDEHVGKVQRKKSNNNESPISKSISNHAVPSIGENRRPHADASGNSEDLEKQREHIPLSNSKVEGSKKKVQNKAGKSYGNNVGGVVSNTQKKSLLEGAIFKEDSNGTSEDEGVVDNSDASTKTPSDNSLLSDFSDADSNDGLDSQQNGLHGGRSALKDGMSGTKMAIDHVLRSSRRYKKAKITASQTESQLEFVPDSLAD